jgi:tight adherence protein B
VRLVLAEDNALLRDGLIRLLEANGFTIVAAVDNAPALDQALADPTADAACETLLVAHEVGGTDLDRRLEALIDDRIQDAHGRKDARAKQAGARFARRFVVLVPAGMALAGMSVGNGRAAYATSTGQLLVVVAILLVVACWFWAGRIMTIPREQRVFDA